MDQPVVEVQDYILPPGLFSVVNLLPENKPVPQVTPLAPAALSTPSQDNLVALTLASPVPEDFKFFQELLRRMAAVLGI